MTYSMTAFSRAQKQLDNSTLCWEIKSVTHRYLDVSFKLPEVFRFLETSLRSILRDHLSRGKIECQLKYQDTDSVHQSIYINEGLVAALMDAAKQLSSNLHLPNDLAVSQLLSWPGVVLLAQVDAQALEQEASALFEQAVRQLLEARRAEGAALKLHVIDRIQRLNSEIQAAKQMADTVVMRSKEKLMTRLQGLDLAVSDARFEQEIALILARLDVTEELDRLQTHVAEVRRILDSDQPSGRRLDFLMQELNREANTLSSKSDQVELTGIAVEMKVLIEQMREQIQNIE